MGSPFSALGFGAGVALAPRPVFLAAAVVSTSWVAWPPPRPRAMKTSFWPLAAADWMSEPPPEFPIVTFRPFFLKYPPSWAMKPRAWLALSAGMTIATGVFAPGFGQG